MSTSDLIWAQIEPSVYIGRDEFMRILAKWDIEEIWIDGALSFATLTCGPEFHFASFGTGARITLPMIRSRLDPIIERHGFVETRTPREGWDRMHRFIRRYGFRDTGENEFNIHYRLEASPWRS